MTKSCLCHNKELNLTCFGCCAKGMKDKKEVIESLLLNTKEFKDMKDVKKFMDRCVGNTRGSGVCVNLVFLAKKRIGCPGHPLLNNSRDFRRNLKGTYCNPDYLCDTAERFNELDSETQKRFIKFLKSKKLDWFSYSKGIDDNSLMKEFLSQL